MNAVTPTAGTGFDYAALPLELADRQRERATRVVALRDRTIEGMGEIGRELLEAQAELEHGTFLDWLRDAAGLSKSTAYRFMDMARAFGPKLPTLGSLPLAVVHQLAAKSTPEPIRLSVLHRIEKGEMVSPDAVRDELRDARETAKAAVAVSREAERRAALTDEERADEDAFNAKGTKGKEARKRKAEKDRVKAHQRAREEKARMEEAATILVNHLGADVAAKFSREYGNLFDLLRQVGVLAQVQRAQSVNAIDIYHTEFADTRLWGVVWLSDESRAEVAAIAAYIENGGTIEPITAELLRPEETKSHSFASYRDRYKIIDGQKRFLALRDVLRLEVIPTRIVPPFVDSAVEKQL